MRISFGIIALARIPELDRLVAALGALRPPDSEIVIAVESNGVESPVETLEADGVRWIRIPAKRGLGYNRNRLLDAVNGDVLVGLDDDVMPREGWLDALLEPLADPNVTAVSGAIEIPRAGILGDAISALGFPAGGSAGFALMFPVAEDGTTRNITTVNWAARVDALRAIGGFNETLTAGGEDTEIAHRLCAKGARIVFRPHAVVVHPARSTLRQFATWFIRRGRAKRQFTRVVSARGYIGERLRSYLQILRANLLSVRILLIVPLLVLSLILQWIGYMAEWIAPSSRPLAMEL